MTHRKISPMAVVETRDGKSACQAAQARHDAKCGNCCLKPALAPQSSLDGLESILRGIDKLSLPSDAVLHREGEAGTYLYSLRSGLLKLLQHLPNGTCRIVRVLRTGDVSGLELLCGTAYRHTAVALGSAGVCRIPAGAMADLDRAHPRLHEELLACWARDVETADWWITHISTGSVGERLARLIGFLKQRDEENPAHLVSLPHREDIAAMLGVATETVCRAITHFQHDGLLRGVGNSLFEFDMAAMHNLAAD